MNEEELKLSEGLLYTDEYRMPSLIDEECKKPSRNLLCRLLIEQGANPNV